MFYKIGWFAIVFITILVAWEYAAQLSSNMKLILPSPSAIAHQMIQSAPRLLFHTRETFKIMLGGIFLSFLVAFPIAWIMSLWSHVSLILQPIFVITQCIPMFVLAPLMVFWFGWSYSAIVIPTALMIFLPLTMNIYQGIRSTPTHYLDYFRVHQATPWQTFYKLQLPWALPHIFAGLRVAAAIAGIGAIAGEWAGAQAGLGLLMLESRRGADLEMMFAALFCLTALSLSLYAMIAFCEHQIFRRKFVHLASKGIQAMGAAILILNLCGCGSNEKSTETRFMLDWLPNPNHVPLYVGINKNFFSEQGINLSLQKIRDSSDPLVYLSSGQTDLAISYMPSAIYAISHETPIKPIAILIDRPLNALIYRKDLGVKAPAELSGKTIGYCVDGSGSASLDRLLQANNIIPKEKLNVSFDLVSTLGTGKVDAIYGAFWNIECEHLRSLGIETDYFSLTDCGVPAYYELIVMARIESLESDADFINRFQKALRQSFEFCRERPDEAFQIYVEANPDKSEKTLRWEKRAWEKTLPLFARNLNVDQDFWESYSTWMLEKESDS